MAIRERTPNNPNKNNGQDDQQRREKLAEAYISGAGTNQIKPVIENEDEGRTPVMVRYKKQMLKKIDAAAKRRGLSRSAWIQYAASRVLEMEEKD